MRSGKILGLLLCIGIMFAVSCTKQTVSDPVPETRDASPYSYYVNGEKKTLTASTKNMTITFSENVSSNPTPPHVDLEFISTHDAKVGSFTLKSDASLTIEEIVSIVRDNNSTVICAYPDFNGSKVTNEAIFKLKSNKSLDDLQSTFDNLGFSISYKDNIGNNMYLYTISNSNTFNFSNKIFESNIVEHSKPNFIIQGINHN